MNIARDRSRPFVPMAVMGALVTAFAFTAESNLWPLLLILVAPFACLCLPALAKARALSS